MVDYLEILRLKHLGYSQRQIMSSVSCSNHTIKAVWDAAQELNWQWPMPENCIIRPLCTQNPRSGYRKSNKSVPPIRYCSTAS